MPRISETRLMVKVARMYYVLGLRQREITDLLQIHQSTVSRMLKKARETHIVRMSVHVPAGIFSELEEALEQKFGLREAIVVDCADEETHMVRDLGEAAAFYLESTVRPGERIGISSWSRHLLAMVDQLQPNQRALNGQVVQILGGVGNPEIQSQATHFTQRLATALGATAVLLQAPGVAGSARIRDLLLEEPYVRDTIKCFSKLDTALVGIGVLRPSPFLASSGNTFTREELETLRKAGAVGDICMRYFGANGNLIRSPLHNRVIGIDLPNLKRVPRIVGIAGGDYKFTAILAALRGRWINVLITDKKTASRLVREELAAPPRRPMQPVGSVTQNV